jgi:hypothetical protein
LVGAGAMMSFSRISMKTAKRTGYFLIKPPNIFFIAMERTNGLQSIKKGYCLIRSIEGNIGIVPMSDISFTSSKELL